MGIYIFCFFHGPGFGLLELSPDSRDRAPRTQGNRNKESTRRNVLVETTNSSALVSCDGFGGYDWSDQAEEGPNYALMAYSTSSSDYEASLKSVEERLEFFKTIESFYLEDVKKLKFEINCNEITIRELRKKLETVQREKDSIQLTVEKLKNALKNLNKLIDSQIVDNCKKGLGYNAVPPPHTGLFMPPKPDFSYIGLKEFTSEPTVETLTAKTSKDVPKVVKKDNGAPIIEDYKSDDEDESVPQPKIEKKTFKPSVAKRLGSNFEKYNKACYECGSFDHLQKKCNYHQRKFQNQKVVKPVWNYNQMVNHKNFAKNTHSYPKRNIVPRAVLIKSGIKLVNAARQKFSKATVTVNTARSVNTAHPKTTMNAVKPRLTNENHVLLRVLRKNNMYSVDLKNIIPKGVLTCLFAKATSDESRLWHRRLGHLNFKIINKLVKGNLGIMRQYSVARTPQQNGVAEKNRTLIEAARTMLPDSKLPTTFWAEAVSTACYVQNRVHVTILNTKDHLGKFDRKADEGFFIGYSSNSKAFRVFNSKTRIVEETLHISQLLQVHNLMLMQGHTQEEGIDYDDVFAPVARIEAIRLFLAYASFNDFMVYQMDVKSAFIYGKIEEEVYVCQPLGFEDPDFPNRVYKVEKALYGLHQAPIAWYETLSTYLLDNGFQRGKIDKALFIRRHKGDILLVQVYVDDIIFGSTKKEWCTSFDKLIHEKFQMTEILKKFGFSEVKTASTPMETQMPLLKDEDGEELDCKKQTVVANSTTVAEYVTASSCYGQVLWIQNQLLDYGFIQTFLDKQLDGLPTNKEKYDVSFHTKKVFANIKRIGKGFSSKETSLFLTMVGPNQVQMGKGSAQPTDTQHTPTFDMPPPKPKKTQKSRPLKRKTTKVPQPSESTDTAADEAAYKEGGDSLVRATTTAFSLEAEQDSGHIDKTQTKATSNESRVNTPQSDEDSLKHIELMKICTTLQKKVLDLEDELKKTKTSQQTKIDGLERRVKKLEKKHDSRTQKLKRLYKVGLTAMRRIYEIDADEDIALVSTHDDELQDKGIEDVEEEEVVEVVTNAMMCIDTVVDDTQVTTVIADAPVSAAETIVTTAPTITTESIKTNIKVTQASKRKGTMIQEPEETTTTKTVSS
nr:ribonuclease H-like domain-containing protein [Tanacetum cinerariifolium]